MWLEYNRLCVFFLFKKNLKYKSVHFFTIFIFLIKIFYYKFGV